MSTAKFQLNNFRNYQLNRLSAKPTIMSYIESCISTENEAAKYSFHKITVHNWADTAEHLISIMGEYFSSIFVPVHIHTQGHLTEFYTSSLTLVMKLITLDFIFPYERNTYNIDVLFNDKCSGELFGNWVTVEDVVSSIVSNRLNEHFELNLSNFCNDPEFLEKKIYFYHVSVLSHFKLLMIRIGRDTKLLNLSNNNLSQVPPGILNFFIKGNLVGINLSNNNIPSLAELHRISSKIEKIWIEGNPLCEDIDPTSYVKQITMKFPRVTEIDGIKLHASGFPFFRNFMVTSDKKAKMFIDKFLSLYFSHFDNNRDKVILFYSKSAKLSISADYELDKPNTEEQLERKTKPINRTLYGKRSEIMKAFHQCLPTSEHDPSTFCVDLMFYDKNSVIIIVDGIFRANVNKTKMPLRYYAFRRTFVLNTFIKREITIFFIDKEMISLRIPTTEEIDNSFKYPVRNIATLELAEPSREDIDTICKAFCQLTQLKRDEGEVRLMVVNWDMKKALSAFLSDMKANLIAPDKFLNDDEDLSDISSLSDEID